MPTPLTTDGSTSDGGGGVASAPRLTMSAAVARANAFGNASSGGIASGSPNMRGGGVASIRSRSAARSASSSADGPSAPRRIRSSSSGNSSTTCSASWTASACVQTASRLEQAAAHQPARPVPAQPADVVALAMSVAGLDHELVEERTVLLRDASSDRCGVGLGDVEMLGGTEQRRQLQRRHLGERGPVDVVAGDRAPRMQVEPGVDGGLARRRSALARRRPT